MRARHQVLLSLCLPLLTLSAAACSDAAGPVLSPSGPTLLHAVTLTPAEATLPAGSHLAITATALAANGDTTTGAVAWASSDTTVATVSGSGDVTAVAPGTAVITARVGALSATAPFTVIPAPAAESVTVAPSRAEVTVGQALQFSARVGDHTPDAKDVVWKSSDPDVATVSSRGLVTGITAGSVSVSATYAGRTAEAAVSVQEPPAAPTTPSTPPESPVPTSPSGTSSASGLWVHQPADLATITDQSWNSMPSGDWQAFTYGHDYLHLVDDGSDPAGDSHVLQFDYPKGYGGGGYGPAVVEYRFSADEVYIGFCWKMSPNWQGHTTGVNKMFYVFQRLSSEERQAIFFVARGGVNGPFHFAISNEPDGGKWFTQNVDNVTIEPGRWYKVELHLKRSSADGAPDGVVEWWVDGQLAARYTDARLRDEPFSELHIDPVWGGHDPSTSKMHDDYFRFGHIHVSGR